MSGVSIIPTGDHPQGVVFYLLHEEDISTAMAEEAAKHIAAFFREPFPGAAFFVVRYGIRDNGDGTYWIGFNHRACGDIFEQLLRGLKTRATKRSSLPVDSSNPNPLLKSNPNPRLKPVFPELVQEAPAPQPRQQPDRGSSQRRRQQPPPPEQGRSLADQSAAARQELGAFDVSGTLRKLSALRKGGWRDIGRRRRGGGSDDES